MNNQSNKAQLSELGKQAQENRLRKIVAIVILSGLLQDCFYAYFEKKCLASLFSAPNV
jgi:hypothetical protein